MNMLFFGLQVAVHAPPGDPWRQRLVAIVRRHVRDLSLADQRGLWGAVANTLIDGDARLRLGFWDLVPNGRAEYGDWVKGIEDDTAEPWVPDASGAAMDCILVSAMFLLPAGGASAAMLGERCDLPESRWRQRTTWRHLLASLPMLDFASVQSDALYVTPGGDDAAFSLRELQGEGYDYLLRVE